MNNPVLYKSSNQLQRQANIQILNEYASKIKWRDNTDSFMDLGCGDGEMTTIIKKYATAKDVKIVAIDVSENMIEYAKKHFSYQNITFRVLNMDDDLPHELKGKFNHLFSFFAMQYSKNQEKVFGSIYDQLTKGGDCLLSIVKDVPFFYLYKDLSCKNKYQAWLTDVNNFISPYHYMEDALAKKMITELMVKVGFTNIEVQCKKMCYVMKNGIEFKNTLKAIESFNMPMEVFEEFLKDNVPLAQELGLIDKTCSRFEDYDKPINFKYVQIVVFATKP